MSHTALSHTADTGIEATAGTFSDLIGELAAGMFVLMAEVDPCPTEPQLTTTIKASSNEDLVVDSLSELLYLSETEGLHFCRFDVEVSKTTVRIQAAGIPTKDAAAIGPSIKAVTYHQLEVSETDDGWYARVYFDV